MAKKTNVIHELEAEKNKLYVTKENPKRLKEIIDKLNFYYYGIKLLKNVKTLINVCVFKK